MTKDAQGHQAEGIEQEIAGAEQALTDEELDVLIEQIRTTTPTGKRNLAMILLMADSALRVSEVLDLEPKDVVRKCGQITHVVIRNGKGGKAARQAVTGRTAVALADWEQERETMGIGEYPLFCTISSGKATGTASDGQKLEPGRRLNRTYVGQVCQRLGKRAGFGRRVHPHGLRHTAITRYLRANRDLERTRRYARHADISTTSRIYAHLVDEDVDAGVAIMEQAAQPQAAQASGLEGLSPEQIAGMAGWTPEQLEAFGRGLGQAVKESETDDA